MPLTLESCAAQHIGDREEQQDRVGIFPHPTNKGALLAVVADGMGGLSGGALAAEQVIHVARTCFDGMQSTTDVPGVLAAAINDSHHTIKLTAYSSEKEPHSTVCLLVLHSGRVDWAHCGDSRIYYFRKGQLVARSIDHSVVMRRMVLPGYLTEEQAEVHPNKNFLSSCLGDDAMPEIDFGGTESLQDGDVFMLCSDGLWAYFKNDELGQILDQEVPRKAAEILIERARERSLGRGDNVSLAIIRVREVEAPKLAMPAARPGTQA